MIRKINGLITNHKTGTTSCDNIYIVDYKNINGGEVELFCEEPLERSVFLDNQQPIEIFYDLFLDNALVIAPGNHSKQCECILFPTSLNDEDWILFIETKYANDIQAAFNKEADYPNCMIEQIIGCVNFFRDKDIIPKTKKVHAILSFPTLIQDFSESFLLRSDLTPEEILENHKIIIRPSNSIQIKSNKRLKI